jgi:heat shock protein HslJ
MNKLNNKVSALTGGLVCLLMTGCHKEELVAPTGAAMYSSAAATHGTPSMKADPNLNTASYEPWVTGDAIPALPPTALNGRWMLNTLNGRPLRVATMDLPWLVVQIAPQEGGQGTVNGFGGCNRIRGTANQEGTGLAFTDLGRTRMYCAATHDLEEEFFAALRATDQFEESGPVLRLLAGTSELAVLLRVDHIPPEAAVR